MLKEVLESGCKLTDAALERLIPPATQQPEAIHRAMRHSVFAGGKRLRPILCYEAARMLRSQEGGGDLPAGIEDLGSALEMIHTYSLIHDDLPALDNDDLRRGKPTCHVAYGEATAILAGDALQTLAYETLSSLLCPPEARVRIVREVARQTGTVNGMIGGQVMDLEAERSAPDAARIEQIHRAKTGALITASLVSGGIYAASDSRGPTPRVTDVEEDAISRLRHFGENIGLAFQIVDDVLDVTQTSEQLGKTAGKDVSSSKATYPALFGVDESLHIADRLIADGCAQLDPFGAGGETLKELARFLVQRKS